MSGAFYLQTAIHESDLLLVRLQPGMHRCNLCKIRAQTLEPHLAELRRLLGALRQVSEALLDGGIKTFLQTLGQCLFRLGAVLEDIASGRGSHASHLVTRLLSSIFSRRPNVHDGFRRAESEIQTMVTILRGFVEMLHFVGASEVGWDPSECTPDDTLHRATRVMSGPDDAYTLLKRLERVPGLLQVEPFWYQCTVSHSRMLRLLHASHAALTHSLAFTSAVARLLVFCALQPLFVLVPALARWRIRRLYHAPDHVAINAGVDPPFTAAVRPPRRLPRTHRRTVSLEMEMWHRRGHRRQRSAASESGSVSAEESDSSVGSGAGGGGTGTGTGTGTGDGVRAGGHGYSGGSGSGAGSSGQGSRVPTPLPMLAPSSAPGILTAAPRAPTGSQPRDSYLLQVTKGVFALNEIPPLRFLERRLYLHVKTLLRLTVCGSARVHHRPVAAVADDEALHGCLACAECAGVSYDVAYDGASASAPAAGGTGGATGTAGAALTARAGREPDGSLAPPPLTSGGPLVADRRLRVQCVVFAAHALPGIPHHGSDTYTPSTRGGVARPQPVRPGGTPGPGTPPALRPSRAAQQTLPSGGGSSETAVADSLRRSGHHVHHPLPPLMDTFTVRAVLQMARSLVARLLSLLVWAFWQRVLGVVRALIRLLLWGPILFALDVLAYGLGASLVLSWRAPTRASTAAAVTAAEEEARAAGDTASLGGSAADDASGEGERSRPGSRSSSFAFAGLSRMSIGGLMGELGFLEGLRRAARARRAGHKAAARMGAADAAPAGSAPLWRLSGGGLPGAPSTPAVVLHFHGGGFVSQSVETHQHYLRLWSNATGVVVVSVNYTLAPYPQALLECFMVYRWLADGHLGFHPSQIILAGDSAGGNIALAVTLKALQEGVRAPDGLLLFYPAVFCYPTPTPSRLMFGNDPVIPRVMLAACLEAYLPHLRHNHAALADMFVSPGLAPDELLVQFPPVRVAVGSFDPLLDDSVEFTRRLRQLGVDVELHIHEALPHGFLSVQLLLPQAVAAMEHSCTVLAALLRRADTRPCTPVPSSPVVG